MGKAYNSRTKLIAVAQFILITSLFLFSIALTGCTSIQKGPKGHAVLEEPRIAPLPESQWNEAQKKALAPFTKGGAAPNIFTTFIKNEKLFDRHGKFGMYILFEQTLPPRDREILILRIGWLCRSEYEFGQHTLFGKKVGLTKEEILNVTKGSNAPGWSPFDAALIKAVDELYYYDFISDGTWKVLATKYNEQQLLDMICTVGQYNLISWALNSLGVQLDKGVPGFPEGSK